MLQGATVEGVDKPSEVDYDREAWTNGLLETVATLKRFKPLLVKALKHAHGTHTFDDIVALVLSGRFQLWTQKSAIVLTEFQTYPQCKVLHVFLAGGNIHELIDVHPKIAKFAREQGCTAITLTGRKGWVRALDHMGWKESAVTLRLDLTVTQEFDEWAVVEEKAEAKK